MYTDQAMKSVSLGHSVGKRVQCRVACDNVLDGRGTTVGMDSDILVHLPRSEYGWYPSLWGDRVLAVPVSLALDTRLTRHVWRDLSWFKKIRILKNRR